MRKVGFVLWNILKSNIKSSLFMRMYIPHLVILSLIVIIGWPGGNLLDFNPPQLFPVFFYTQMILISYIGARLAIGVYWDNEVSIEDWLRYTPLSSVQVGIAEIAAVLAAGLLVLLSSLPLIILCYSVGGLFFKSVIVLYSLLLVCLISFTNFGLLLQFIRADSSSFMLIGVVFLFALGLFLTRTNQPNLFYINPLFVLFILLLSTGPSAIFLRKLNKIKRDLVYES